MSDVGVLGPPLVVGGFTCDTAIPVQLPDGATIVVVRDEATALRLIHFVADGSLDTSIGGGSGVTQVDMSVIGATNVLSDASNDSQGHVFVLLDSSVTGSRLVKFSVAGVPDVGFGDRGVVRIDGDAKNVTIDAEVGVTVSVGYTFALHPTSPRHPAILRLTPTGAIDVRFNPTSARPGWCDITELGIVVDALGGAHVPVGEGLFMAISTLPPDLNDRTAILLKLERSSPTSLGPATVEQPAVRVGNASPP